MESDCGDGEDNNGVDGVDCADPDCAGNPECLVEVGCGPDITVFENECDDLRPWLQYLVNASMKPGEDPLGILDLLGAGVTSLDVIASAIGPVLDLNGSGSLVDDRTPYLHSVRFWEAIEDRGAPMDGFIEVDELDLLPSLFRAIGAGGGAGGLGAGGLGVDLSTRPSARIMAVVGGAAAGVEETYAFEAFVQALKPSLTVSGARETVLDGLMIDLQDGFTSGEDFDPFTSLYAGWQFGGPVDEGWNQDGLDWAADEWQDGETPVYLYFFEQFVPEVLPPVDELPIWEWRSSDVDLPTMTPGVRGG